MTNRWRAEQVSVVIPTYNRAPVLARVLTALAAQTLPPHRFEVIVVDDGSTDGTPAHLAAVQATCPYRLTRLRQANRGPAAARNAGLAAARGDIVVFVDDDCIPEPALLAEHVASHSVERLAVIGHIAWHPEVATTPIMRYCDEHIIRHSAIKLHFDAPFAFFLTGNASVHRASALAVGGFDEDFRRMEDVEFAYRLRRHGVRFVLNDQACVLHYRTIDLPAMLEQQRMTGWEALRLWAKHPELDWFMPLPHLLDPAWRRHVYRVLSGYYFTLGVHEALTEARHLDATECLPAGFADEAPLWSDGRIDTLHDELEQAHLLHRSMLAQLERTRHWADHLEQAQTRLRSAYQQQSTWAADLVRQLDALRLSSPVHKLARQVSQLPARLSERRTASPTMDTSPSPAARRQRNERSATTTDARSGSWQAEQVSVVIPTYNRAPVLARVLTALAAQTLPPHRFEVIVVDDGSTDGTPAHLAAVQATCPYRLTRLRQANRGPAAARNAGLAAARGDIVVFVDDDCIPEPALLAEHVASHSVERLAVIGHIAWHPEVATTPFRRYAEPHLFFAQANLALPPDTLWAHFCAGNASVHRASALAVGGFDEDFPHATMEDIDFAYRLRRQGAGFIFNHRAHVLHHHTADLLPSLDHARHRGRASKRLWEAHPELRALLSPDRLFDPEQRRQYYDAVTTYYLVLGVQEALADRRHFNLSETLPAFFQAEARRWRDQRLGALGAELERAHGLHRGVVAELEQMSQWAMQLEHELTHMQAAFEEQAAWVAAMQERLLAQQAPHLLTGLWRVRERLVTGLGAHQRIVPAGNAAIQKGASHE